MRIADGKQAVWEQTVSINAGEPYGECVVNFAKAWADLMEIALDNGETIDVCADRLFSAVDKLPLARGGITGFQYGCIISILADVWEHGDALRRWHNLKTQIKHEGERANETGGVLNPAVLVIGEGPHEG